MYTTTAFTSPSCNRITLTNVSSADQTTTAPSSPSRRPATLPQFTAAPARRVRALMYGAGGAFRGLAARANSLREDINDNIGRFNNNNNWRGGNGNGNNDDDDDDGMVDPSWGVAPGVHVVMRERCDEVYRKTVANLMQMSAVALATTTTPVFVGGDPTVPVVILLSWMGAQKKHLAKYAKFYEDLGYEVHCVFNGLKTAIFPPASRAQASRVEELIDRQPDGRPVFVHAFSIGTGIYGLLLHGIRNEKEKLERLKKRVVGVVFDSGPAPIFPVDVAKGLHTVCPMISKAVWEPIARTFFFVTKARKAYGAGEEALRKLQLPSPQLYFYSLDDKIIPNVHHAVEEFIEKNKQRGLEVYNKWWANSVHAAHIKLHQDEYLANLDSFVRRCMELWNKNRDPVTEKMPATAITAAS